MNYEEKILTSLAESYRKSRKDSGENRIKRRTQAKPEKFYKKYKANDGDFQEISKLNQAVEALSKKGFVTSRAETFGTQLQCIYLVDEKIREVEEYLGEKYGYVSKDRKLQWLQELVERYQKASPACQKVCAGLEKCITERRLPQNLKELEDVLKVIAFLEKNQENLYIREASMKIYGDSKYLENVTLEPVCRMLRRYAGRTSREELLDEILLDYHIQREPGKLCIKGNAEISISGKEVDISGFTEGMEFLSSDLPQISKVKIRAAKFMTIENRTSYLRYSDADTVTFYLGGYAHRYQRNFIKLVSEYNPNLEFFHFGDIDAGGFWIHHNLQEITGVKFGLFAMSAEELENPAYAGCLQPLSENDRSRLQELRKVESYRETVEYMLEKNVKLEQEIVSLDLMKGKSPFYFPPICSNIS